MSGIQINFHREYYFLSLFVFFYVITIQILRVLNIFDVIIISSNYLILKILTRLIVVEILILNSKNITVKLHVLNMVSP